MMRSAASLMAVVFVSALLVVFSGCKSWHGERGAKLSPEASAAIQKEYPGAKVEKAKAETEDGVKVYEVELESGESEMEASVTEGGMIVEIDTPIGANDLPQAVKDAVAKAAPGAEIKEVKKSETLADAKAGKLAAPKVAYVVEVAKEGQEGELKVAADGTIAAELKWEEKEQGKGDKNENEENGGDKNEKGEHAD